MKISQNKLALFLILLLPLVSVLADTTIRYFEGALFHIGHFRLLVILAIILLFLYKGRHYNAIENKLIMIFCIYIFILSWFSSNILSSLDGVIKWSAAMLLYPVGYHFFEKKEDLARLSKYLIIGTSFIILNFLFAQIYSIGPSPYVEDSIYYGGASWGVANILTLSILFSPVVFMFEEKKYVNRVVLYVLLSISLFIVLILFKRSALFSLLIGLVTYLVFNTNKVKNLFVIILLAGVGLSLIYVNQDLFEERMEVRLGEERPIANEGRVVEMHYIMNDFIYLGNKHRLFGTDIFNSQESFGIRYFNRERIIHGDFSKILHGSGLVGFIILISIIALITIRNVKYRKILTSNGLDNKMSAIFYSILISYLFIMLTGTGLTIHSLSFLILGSINGYHKKKIYQ